VLRILHWLVYFSEKRNYTAQCNFLPGMLTVTALTSCPQSSPPRYAESPQHRDGRFRNPLPRPSLGFWQGLKLTWTFFFAKPKHTVPDRAIPVRAIDIAALEAAP